MKVLLVGGSGDLGNAIGTALDNKGFDFVTTTSQQQKVNDNCYLMDVSNDDVSVVIERIIREHEQIHGLIYLPAISQDGPLHRLPMVSWSEVMDVNFFGAVRLVQTLIPHFIKQKTGIFQFVSSTAAVNGGRGIAPYACSKSALNTLAKCVSKEYARFGINAFCIMPGYVDAGLIKQLNTKQREIRQKNIDLGRFARVEEIAEFCVATLANSSYLSGNLLTIDGGLHE